MRPSSCRTLAAILVQALVVLGALVASGSSAGAIGFAPAPGSPYSAGASDDVLEAADLGAGGRSDVVFASNAGVGVLLSSALGQLFPLLGSPFSAPESHWIAPADVNGDGLPDLVSANYLGNDASVLLANGSGSFTTAPGSPFAVESGTNPVSVAVADFNGDGHPDLAFAACGAACSGTGEPRISLYLGDGSGRFTRAPGSPFAAGLTEIGTIVAADFNHDGKVDVAVGGKGHVAVLLGDGEGALKPAPGSPFATGSSEYVYDIAAGDLNGDGNPDVVAADWIEHTVTVMLGDGDGRLAATGPPIATGSSGAAQSVVIADMDANGTEDVVVTNEKNDPEQGDVSILLGDGHGNLTPAPGSPFPAGGEAFFGRVGDFDGDGQPDVATANGDDRSVSVLLNTNHAAVGASADSLAFARLGVGQASPAQTLTLTNTGDGFLRPSAATIVGSQAGDYSIAQDGCAGLTMIVGQSCSIGVSFHPTAADTRSASLEVPTNAPSGASVFGLAGTGLAIPGLTSVLLRPSRFAVLAHGHRYKSHGPHHGSVLLLTLSETATVRVAVTQHVTGHRRGGGCHTRGHGRRCTLTVKRGHLNARLRAGRDELSFPGVIGGRALRAGSYTATVTAINDESLSSPPVKLRFTILR